MKPFKYKQLFTIIGLFTGLAIAFTACKEDDNTDPEGPGTELSITDFTPKTARVGDTVVITGTGFNADFSQNTVFFTGSQTNTTPGLAQAVVIAGSTTSISARVPSDVLDGPITVRTGEEEAVSEADFTLDTSLGAPVLSSIDPTNGLPGVTVTISGENFGDAVEDLEVLFGETEATVTAVTNTSITTKVPESLAEGEVQVSVSREGTAATSTLSFTVNPLPVDVKTAYWTSLEGILRGNITETGVDITTLYDESNEGLGSPSGIDVDFVGGMIYFTSTNGVSRASIEGDGTVELLYESKQSTDIAIDPTAGKVYFFSIDGAAEQTFIIKGDMDGTGEADTLYRFDYTLSFETFLYEGPQPYTPKLLLADNQIYWTETGTNPRVMVGSVTGDTDPVELYGSDELIQPTGIALDPVNQKIYISDNGVNEALESTIYVGNLDGSGSLAVLVGAGDFVNSPSDMEIDLENGFIYWLNVKESTSGAVAPSALVRASLDGSAVEVLFDGFSGAIFFDLEIGVVE
ncbi:hypothetical protein GCM10011506_05690 [Marivirga lumbricoides]|uniref:IPT/TIG domain-containing protein n=1 Tax=Marivirga lumbricoides TaxID=1046115 RepID=A0ABQ1LDQ2_9BACT|nr:hypothetical protein GCM10011506_05690 [Marivirga lumbricoides]